MLFYVSFCPCTSLLDIVALAPGIAASHLSVDASTSCVSVADAKTGKRIFFFLFFWVWWRVRWEGWLGFLFAPQQYFQPARGAFNGRLEPEAMVITLETIVMSFWITLRIKIVELHFITSCHFHHLHVIAPLCHPPGSEFVENNRWRSQSCCFCLPYYQQDFSSGTGKKNTEAYFWTTFKFPPIWVVQSIFEDRIVVWDLSTPTLNFLWSR